MKQTFCATQEMSISADFQYGFWFSHLASAQLMVGAGRIACLVT